MEILCNSQGGLLILVSGFYTTYKFSCSDAFSWFGYKTRGLGLAVNGLKAPQAYFSYLKSGSK